MSEPVSTISAFEKIPEMMNEEFVRVALGAASVIGALCSYLGIHVVLRRIVFVGAALAEISALGVAVSVYNEWDPLKCSLGAVFVGVVLFSLPMRRGRIPEDGYIGISYAAAWAGALVLLYVAPHGEGEMMHLLQGDILGVQIEDLQVLLYVFGAVAIFHLLFMKEFWMVSFDPEMAQTLGLRTWWWNFLFYLSLGVAIALAIRAAGVLLVFSFLVLPSITGLLLSSRKGWVMTFSLISSLVAAFVGVWLSYTYAEISTGPAIVLCSFALFILAWVTRRVLGQ